MAAPAKPAEAPPRDAQLRDAQLRAGRLAAALRENLKRRKLQVKGRATVGAEAGPDSGQAASHDSAGFVPDKSTD